MKEKKENRIEHDVRNMRENLQELRIRACDNTQYRLKKGACVLAQNLWKLHHNYGGVESLRALKTSRKTHQLIYIDICSADQSDIPMDENGAFILNDFSFGASLDEEHTLETSDYFYFNHFNNEDEIYALIDYVLKNII